MRVRNLDTKGNTLAAAFTFSHGTCTSCSEVRNQNNQLDYCSRLPGKMQAFFQKILRFFGKPNSFSHRCAMPAVPLLALCATSPDRGSLSQRGSHWQDHKLCRTAKASLREKDFPRPGQILPAPGRNVTTGDKERNRCHVSDKRGNRGTASAVEGVIPPCLKPQKIVLYMVY